MNKNVEYHEQRPAALLKADLFDEALQGSWR
jgi:hypothetical protein